MTEKPKPEYFPRTTDLPSQSPLFWVEQKDRYLRQILIRDIEAMTKRRLVVYFANRYENAQIETRDVALITETLGDLNGAPFDLFLETSGGMTDATEGMINVIRNHAEDFRVIVTNAAKSNGTLLGLAARSIVMGSSSELGPIEPSVQGVPCSILAEPTIAASNFALHKVGVFALQQTRSLAENLLTTGMMKGKKPAEIAEAIRVLSTREVFYSHGSVIDHQSAKDIGLAVEYLEPKDALWQRLWLLYCMYDHDTRKDRLLKVFEGCARSTSIAAPPVSTKPSP